MAAKPQNQQPPAESTDSGRPKTGSGKGRRDAVGHIPDNIHIDPNITKGHPGYEESGDSEITLPPKTTNEPSAPPKKS